MRLNVSRSERPMLCGVTRHSRGKEGEEGEEMMMGQVSTISAVVIRFCGPLEEGVEVGDEDGDGEDDWAEIA